MSEADDPSAPSDPDAPATDGATVSPAGIARSPSRIRDWRWWVGGVGKTLITVGLLMFGFVAYQLWGTGIETARAQNQLEREFEDLLGAPPTTVDPTPSVPDDSLPPDSPADSVPTGTAPPTSAAEPPEQELPAFSEGDPIARIEIPTIGVDKIVVAGVSTGDLKQGPGHYPDTPLPGQLGNSAIAAHRTTYGQPFFDIDKVQPGDEVIMTTPAGRFVYRVTGSEIVTPSDYWVVATTDPARATLTLTSCDPKWTARDRIVVFAELDAAASSAPAGRAVIDYGRSTNEEPTSIDPVDTVVGGSVPGESVPAGSVPGGSVPGESAPGDSVVAADDAPVDPEHDEIAEAFSEGWFSDSQAWPQVALWGLVLAAIAIGGIALGRLVGRRWVGWLAAAVPFLCCLYFFYQNVNRLLPPGL